MAILGHNFQVSQIKTLKAFFPLIIEFIYWFSDCLLSLVTRFSSHFLKVFFITNYNFYFDFLEFSANWRKQIVALPFKGHTQQHNQITSFELFPESVECAIISGCLEMKPSTSGRAKETKLLAKISCLKYICTPMILSTFMHQNWFLLIRTSTNMTVLSDIPLHLS